MLLVLWTFLRYLVPVWWARVHIVGEHVAKGQQLFVHVSRLRSTTVTSMDKFSPGEPDSSWSPMEKLVDLITKMPTFSRRSFQQIIPPYAQINHVFAFQPQSLPSIARQNVLKIGGGSHVPNFQVRAMWKKPIRKIQITAHVANGQHLNVAWQFKPG